MTEVFDTEMTPEREIAIKHIVAYPESVLHRSIIQDFFTIVEPYEVELENNNNLLPINDRGPTLNGNIEPFVNMIVKHNNTIYRVKEIIQKTLDTKPTLLLEQTDLKFLKNRPLLSPQLEFVLQPGQIENYPKDIKNTPLRTSIGLFITNYILFASVFGSIVPYQNEIITEGLLKKVLVDRILDKIVTIEQTRNHYNHLMYLATMSEFFSPNLNEKSLRPNKEIAARKKELVEKYRKELDAGDGITMVKIERELIDMDREALKNDPSSRYIQTNKQFSIIRKKTTGLVGALESPELDGSLTFVENSLEEGWQQKDIPALFNDSRTGSESRAMETAKSGNISNILLRIFQNFGISFTDCKATKGIKVKLKSWNIDDYTGRHYIQNGKSFLLTKEIAEKNLDNVIELRSPQYCSPNKDKGGTKGLCYVCMRSIFKTLGQNQVATSIQTFSSTHLQNSLKRFHGKVINLFTVDDIDSFTF